MNNLQFQIMHINIEDGIKDMFSLLNGLFTTTSVDPTNRKMQVSVDESTAEIIVADRKNIDNNTYYDITVIAEESVLLEFRGTILSILKEHSKEGATYILKDEVSERYCGEFYLLIYRLENNFRSFLLNFMLKNIGVNWWQLHAEGSKKLTDASDRPKIEPWEYIKDSIKNQIYKIDFIDLLTFLDYHPSPKKKLSGSDLMKEIKRIGSADGWEAVQEYIDSNQNNWDKYFSGLFDLAFKEKWKTMYKYRNVIAHTGIVDKKFSTEFHTLYQSINDSLEKAIAMLETYRPTSAERENTTNWITGNGYKRLKDEYGKSYEDIKNFVNVVRAREDNSQIFTTEEIMKYLTGDYRSGRDLNYLVGHILGQEKTELKIARGKMPGTWEAYR